MVAWERIACGTRSSGSSSNGLDLEPGVTQPGCDVVRPMAVDMDLHRVAAITVGLERGTSQTRNPSCCGPPGRNARWKCSKTVDTSSSGTWINDHRASRPGHRSVTKLQVRHRTHLEPQVGIVTQGHVDHPRGEIDAEGVDTEFPQVGGDGSGAAADVRHWAAAAGPHTIGEHCRSGPKVLVTGDGTAQLIGIADSDRVVTGSGVGQPLVPGRDRHDIRDRDLVGSRRATGIEVSDASHRQAGHVSRVGASACSVEGVGQGSTVRGGHC